MAVSLYFGLPGCGKTTLMVSKAIQAVKSKRYQNVYCNVRIAVFGVTYIDNDCIGNYDLSNCLVLIDEATLFADNRAHKDFSREKIEYFLLHRHYNADIILFTQQWDGVDRKIRVITDRVYYVYKGFFTGHWISKYYRIPYGIIIPDPRNKSSGEKLGDIVQGYCKPNIFIRMFAKQIYRPPLYKYFDSWQHKQLANLPAKYKPYFEVADNGEVIESFADYKFYRKSNNRKRFFASLNKSSILLRSIPTKIKGFFSQLVAPLLRNAQDDENTPDR